MMNVIYSAVAKLANPISQDSNMLIICVPSIWLGPLPKGPKGGVG